MRRTQRVGRFDEAAAVGRMPDKFMVIRANRVKMCNAIG